MVIDIVQTRGSRYEMGVQQGRIYRMLVGDLNMIKVFREMGLVQAAKPVGGPPFNFIFSQMVRAGGRKLLNSIKDIYPHQYDRLVGIAEGFGVSELDLASTLYMESMSGDCRMDMNIPKACTGGIIRKGDQAFILKNYDFPTELGNYQILRFSDLQGEDGYKTIGLGEGPLVGVISGMNEKGVAISYNAAYSNDLNLRAPPISMSVQECLETTATAKKALDFLEVAPIPNATIIIILDKDGDGYILERTPHSAGYRTLAESGDSYIASGNTFLCAEPIEKQLPAGTSWNVKGIEGLEVLKGSKGRGEQMEAHLENLAQNDKKIEVDDLLKILASYHPNEPHGGDLSICRRHKYWKTLSSVVFDTKTLTTHVSDSYPDEVEQMDAYPFEFKYALPDFRFLKRNISDNELKLF